MARGSTKRKQKTEVVEVVETALEEAKPEPVLEETSDPSWIRTKLDAAVSRCIPTLKIDRHLFDLADNYLDAPDYARQKQARRDLQTYISRRIQDYAHSLRLGEAMPSTRATVRVGVQQGNPDTVGIMAKVKGRHGFLSPWEHEVTRWFTVTKGENQ